MATAITESNIHVFANSAVPASLNCPFDKGFVGKDHDSVGIFQQRVSIFGKNNVCAPMDPTTSAKTFLGELMSQVPNFNDASVQIGDAAQKVQRSAFPARYQTHAAQATSICRAAGF